ncbi:hypothetical protein KTT_29060 [Tengunoibacter tsumagoiensis]|uniref:Uncharacterized protein n=1 Tax=Tengunoibacter tsumagoiensis TaxID=2014871 RepID=A0A402A1M1_9CHLR|nr:hypothetical protein KTT_29060 [Tengunoibacter tsumagoiensis]
MPENQKRSQRRAELQNRVLLERVDTRAGRQAPVAQALDSSLVHPAPEMAVPIQPMTGAFDQVPMGAYEQNHS